MSVANRWGDGLARRLRADLALWLPATTDQCALKADYEQFLTEELAAAVARDLSRDHVTGSAFVFTPDARHVLLCFHKKAGLWLQLGGHIEPDDQSVQATAHREALEEAGIVELRAIGRTPLDLDRHALGPGFTHCDNHWDIGYGFLATGEPVVTDESDAVAWWPLDGLPDHAPAGLGTRVHRAALIASEQQRRTALSSGEGQAPVGGR